MTKVEAIKFGTAWLGIQEKLEGCEMYEFFKMSVKALQEEPCDIDTIEALKPVTPKPKTGHWIRVTDKTGHLVWECDKCGWQQRFNTNFCPDCGAKMESEEN